MPARCACSHTSHFKALAGCARSGGASRVTQRHALFALLSAALVAVGACATAGPKPGAGDSIDVRDEQGHEGTLGGMRGRVVVIDLCASSVAACNVNARILDEAANAFRGQPVELITVLIDDDDLVARAALRAYRDVLGVKHGVFLAGSHVRAGTSALGDPTSVPRLVVLDAQGAIRVDDAGGVLNLQGLVNRVTPLLEGARLTNAGAGAAGP